MAAALAAPGRWYRSPVIAIGAIAVTAGLAIHGGVSFEVARSWRTSVELASASADFKARLAAARIEQWATGVRRLARLMEEHVRQATPGENFRAYIERRAADLLHDPSLGMSAVVVLGLDGHQHFAIGEVSPAEATITAALAWARDPRHQGPPMRYGRPETGPDPGIWRLPLAARLTGADGAVRAVALMTIEGGTLGRILRDANLCDRCDLSVWSVDGYLLDDIGGKAVDAARVDASAPDWSRVERHFAAVRPAMSGSLQVSVSIADPPEFADFVRERAALHRAEAVLLLLLGIATGLGLLVRAQVRSRGQRIAIEREATAARQREAEFSHILNGVAGGIYRLRVEPGKMPLRYFTSAGVARVARRSMEEIESVPALITWAEPPIGERELARCHQELSTGGQTVMECQVRCGDGSLRWLRFHLNVIGRVDDTLDCIGLVTDIDVERAAASSAIAAARLATLGEATAAMAHEIRQPLASIGMLAEATKVHCRQPLDGATTDMVVEIQERIAGLVRRLGATLDHVMRFVHGDEMTSSTIDVAAAIEAAARVSGGARRAARISLEVEVPADLPPVLGQQLLFEQVLVNLLNNARDAIVAAMPRERRITVSGAVVGTSVRLRIADSGRGIPTEVLPRVFEAFFTTKPLGEGTGLGLSLSAGVIGAFGGTIDAANEPSGGAVFTLTLRIAGDAADSQET